jgi:hypothetical protein
MSGFLCSMVGVSPAAAAGRTANTITTLGDAKVSTAQSQFGGASALFDGTGDKLTIPYSSDLTLSTTDWTVEYWIRIISQTGGYTNTVGMWDDTTGDGVAYYFSCNMYDTTRSMGIQYFYGGTNSGPITFGSTLTTGTWQHHAFVKNGNTLTAYKDGTSQGTHDMTGRTISPSNQTNLTSLKIGGLVSGGYFNGYLDEIRISNTARYTTTFTPSASAFTNDANTLLLIHADGTNASTVFTDDIGTNAIPRTPVTVGRDSTGAVISTAQSKFGGASLRVSYTSSTWDYLQITSPSSLLNFGTGDWTVEGWFRFDNTNTDAALWSGATSTGDFDIRRTDDNLLRIGRVNTAWDVISGSTGIAANTWYHLAFVKSGGTARIYVDGTEVGSASNAISYSIATQVRIGAHSTSSLGLAGYIDDLRVSNTARYTAGFSAPTAAFTNDRNTLLLLHMDGTNNSTVFTDDNA